MQSVDNRRLAFSFKWGFTLDKIVEIINRYNAGKIPTEDEKEILGKARELFSMILEGEKQASTGNFNMNFLESIKIFNRSLSIINTEEFLFNMSRAQDMSNNDIKDIIEYMDSNIKKLILMSSLGEKDIFKIEILFFNLLRDLTLTESQNFIDGFYETRGLRKWSSLRKHIS